MRVPLPELICLRPEQPLGFTYRCFGATAIDSCKRLDLLMADSPAPWSRTSRFSWESDLLWRTLVFGLVAREFEEHVTLNLLDTEDGAAIEISCFPQETHNAHATGAAGVVLLAATVTIMTGWPSGLLPGFATLAAGGLLCDTTRVYGMSALERELRRRIETTAASLWPGIHGQIEELQQGRHG